MNERKFLTGNQLKLIAAMAMTFDHIGAYLFPQIEILRIIGRIAFPIFAYMIAEGCAYTKSRKRYLFTMATAAAVFQTVYYLAEGSLYQCIFVTFTLSIILCFAVERAIKRNDVKGWMLAIAGVVIVYMITEVLPYILKNTDFSVDYGFYGVLIPVAVFVGRNKWDKLLLFAFGLIMLAMVSGYLQWYSLAAVPLLALYNGKRGKLKLKYFFYVFYPLHLVVIYLIGMFPG